MLKTEFKHTGRVYKVQTFGTLHGFEKTGIVSNISRFLWGLPEAQAHAG
jgi:hypothetical protein